MRKNLFLLTLLSCFLISSSAPAEESKYLNAVCEFADNVLKHGRDTYGPKHTPLFVDGLNVHTREPVKWIAPNGDRWILCNLASQQNLFRTLDGLTRVTGDLKYKQASMEAIKYAFENLRSPNGLLYWGGHIAYDVGDEKVCARGPSNNHELKAHFPYYELMWHVDSGATRQFIESFWSAHILDWSNLDMNRHGHTERTLGTPWANEYKGDSVFFWGSGLTFMNTGSDLFYAGAVLSHLSGEKQPLVWAKRLAYRYVETRNPKTGISGYQYSQCKTAFCCGPSIRGDRAQYQFGDDFKGHFVVEGTLFPCYGSTPAVRPRICEFLLGEMLGAQGKQFTQWALEELHAWGKVAYRKEDNSFIPMLTDGTSMEGYVCKKDGYFGPKGRVLKAGRAGPLDFWTYALAYRITGDTFMWEMARNIAQGNKLGDIGPGPEVGSHLDMDTDCSSAYALLGFLELYKSEKNNAFLEMAQKIGDNILAKRFHRGFFVASNRHIYARFDNLEPLSLLHLDAVARTQSSSVPWVWPSSSFLACEYYGRGTAYDTSLIYTLTDSAEPPMTLQVAATVGDLDELRTLLSIESGAPARKQATLDNLFLLAAEAGHAHIVEFLLGEGAQINSGTTTALHYAVQNGHKDVVEFLLAKGADVNAKDGAQQTPIDLAMGRNHKEITQQLLAKGATISSIHVAAKAGDLAKVKAFLEEDADISTADARGLTPLHHAVQAARKGVAEFLIAKGADVNGKGNSGYIPLSWAIWNEDRDMIKLLVTNGADVNFVAEDDWPFLHYLTWNNDRELVELFLAHGAKLNAKDNSGRTEFHIAVSRGNRDLARFLVSKGATAPELYLAACLGDLARVKSLVEEGVDVDTKDEVGWAPLYWAASMAEEEVAEFLIGKGASIDVRTNNNRTPLHQAATAGAAKLTSLLISKGADSNARDEGNSTPLHSAAAGGHKNVAGLLITNGADVNAKDRRGRTPVDLAQRAEHVEIVGLIGEQMLVHDVAVTEVSAPTSCVQGENVLIGVTVENQGDSSGSVVVRLTSLTDGVDVGNQTVAVGGIPDLVFSPENEDKNDFGNNISIGGDANSDGYPDVLIGAKDWQNRRGRAYLFFGGPNMDAKADMVFTGENAGDYFSDQSGAFGDLNHDGYDDVIIGARGYPGEKNDGRVYVYYGGPSIDNVADMIFEGEAGQGSVFGLMVTTSDINHDGHIDLLIGAQNHDHGGEYHPSYSTAADHKLGPLNGRGRVYLYWGGDPMDTTPDVIFEGENRGDWFGRRISARGDVNADGYNDILIGARHGGKESSGRAYLFFGDTKEQLDSECDWIFTGEAPKNQMGSALTIFDIDNDGLDDVLVNARYAADVRGRVYIYWGREKFDGSKPDVILEGEEKSAMSEIECGYFNDDSYGDILAGAWRYPDWMFSRGRAYLFYGNTKAKVDTGCDHVFSGKGGTRAFFGNQVRAGDVNDDGYADALIAAPEVYDGVGRVYLYYGPFSKEANVTFNWDTTNASIGNHTLKVEIPPVPREQNTEDNVKTVTIEVKEPRR